MDKNDGKGTDTQDMGAIIKGAYGQDFTLDGALIDKMVASITASPVIIILQRPLYRFSIVLLFLLFGVAGFFSGIEGTAQVGTDLLSAQGIEQIFLSLDGGSVL